MGNQTNIDTFINDLNAGVFKEKLAHILSECALGTVIHGNGRKKGKVTVELTIEQVGDNDQVIVSHTLSHITPTKRGKRSEEDSTQTPMFVGKGGVMTIDQPKEDMKGQFSLQQV